MADDQDQKPFGGFPDNSNFTPLPDEFVDRFMPDLTRSEIQVFLYILRRTRGFKKQVDLVSLDQLCNGITKADGEVLDRGTGLSKQGAVTAAKSLVKMGLLQMRKRSDPVHGHLPSEYCIKTKGLDLHASEEEAKVWRDALVKRTVQGGKADLTRASPARLTHNKQLYKRQLEREAVSSSSELPATDDDERTIIEALEHFVRADRSIARQVIALARSKDPELSIEDIALLVKLSVPAGYKVQRGGYFLTAIPGVLGSPAFEELRGRKLAPGELGNSEWDRVRFMLRNEMPESIYRNWEDTRQVSCRDAILVIEVPDEATKKITESDYASQIGYALRELRIPVNRVHCTVKQAKKA